MHTFKKVNDRYEIGYWLYESLTMEWMGPGLSPHRSSQPCWHKLFSVTCLDEALKSVSMLNGSVNSINADRMKE